MQKQDKNSKYISLKEAAGLCAYSHEYLALRARQGRLKSLKLGKAWVTKQEWLKEYLAKTEERHHNAKLRTQKKLKKRRKKQKAWFGALIVLIVVFLTTSLFLNEKALISGTKEIFAGNLIIFKEYGQWVSSQVAAVGLKPPSLQKEKEPVLIKRINEDKF